MRRPALSRAALSCIALLLAAPLATAQDRAAVGGGNSDPAFVGSRGLRAAPRPSSDYPPSVAAMERATDADEVEALLKQIRAQLEPGRDTLDEADGAGSVLQFRDQAESLVRRHWSRLGPLARDMYTTNYDRAHPDEQRGVSRYNQIDVNTPEFQLRSGIRDPEQEMRNLEELLVPMLKDLKQATDTALQRAPRR